MILAIKTDVPEAEIHLVRDGVVVAGKKWLAHRQLLETINTSIQKILEEAGITYTDIKGIIFYEGPGSFTGLRIGCSVANALAVSYNLPIAATTGNNWLIDGCEILATNKGLKTVEPNYGSEPHITKPA